MQVWSDPEANCGETEEERISVDLKDKRTAFIFIKGKPVQPLKKCNIIYGSAAVLLLDLLWDVSAVCWQHNVWEKKTDYNKLSSQN